MRSTEATLLTLLAMAVMRTESVRGVGEGIAIAELV
jgi:hypothetical protein